MRIAEIGILTDRTAAERRWSLGMNVFQTYLGEILSHAGIRWRTLDSAAELESCGCDLVLVALADDSKASSEAVLRFAEQGGGVIAYGGLGGAAAARLGCRVDREQGAGYARLDGASGVGSAGAAERRLRYLHAMPWRQADGVEPALAAEQGELAAGEPHGSAIGPALQRFAVGAGFVDRWAVDIPATVVALQQGSQPIVEDGAPAPDGSAALDDGFLKADDVHELDWQHDRRTTETGQPIFAFPYADWWREALLGHLLERALGMGLTVPMIGQWPEGVRHVAAISHDSDGNLEEEAAATLAILDECGIRSSWCMLEPGYSQETYAKIREAGHELAFHYNAVAPDNGFWDEAEFLRQLGWLREVTGQNGPVTNKNHLTRMEGWGEFFRWCEKGGVTCDQSRGPSKKGNVGFPFGTCHPYFPIAWADEKNRAYDVLEIGFLTQDMDHGKWADSSVIVPFLEAVAEVDGIAHFLVHQYHIYRREEVRAAMRRIVTEAQARGFTFWTVRQIERWERLRRTIAVKSLNADGSVVLESSSALTHSGESAAPFVWVPVQNGNESGGAEDLHVRYGVWCRKAAITSIAPDGRG